MVQFWGGASRTVAANRKTMACAFLGPVRVGPGGPGRRVCQQEGSSLAGTRCFPMPFRRYLSSLRAAFLESTINIPSIHLVTVCSPARQVPCPSKALPGTFPELLPSLFENSADCAPEVAAQTLPGVGPAAARAPPPGPRWASTYPVVCC